MKSAAELKKIVKGEWKRINIFIASKWKYKIYEIVTKKPDYPISEIMKIDEIRKHRKEAVKYANSLMKKNVEEILSKDEEFNTLKSAEKFFENEIKSDIFADPHLVLKGLNIILNYNNEYSQV